MKLDIPTVQDPQKNAMKKHLVDADNKSKVIKKSGDQELVASQFTPQAGGMGNKTRL